MQKRIRYAAVLLAIALLLQGCQLWPAPLTTTHSTAPQTTEQNTTEEAPAAPTFDPGDPALIRWQNAGNRDYLDDTPVRMVPFEEMEYHRPNVEAMYADFDALIAQAAVSEDAESLLAGYYQVYDQYIDFYSMDTLANIRYSLQTTDDYYKAEYDFCEAESPNVEEKLEALYKAFAASTVRTQLEEKYFGVGYFLQYDDYEVYTNETYLALSQEEKRVLAEYRALIQDPQIELNGETKSVNELLASEDYAIYLAALKGYYEKYNPLVGEKYLELVRIRKQLARALDYESYAEYSYDLGYGRDYTPAQGTAFINAIETNLVPLYRALQSSPLYYGRSASGVKEKQVREMVQSAAQEIGGTADDAFRFMDAYHLYDITQDVNKLDASFESYLYNYEAPFVLVNSTGTSSDYTTFAHEFGHFTDAYHNYDAEEDLETAETFSQAMEFLALCYCTTLRASQRTELLQSQLVDVLETFISQAAFARFEDLVYALPDEELTLEKVNQLYLRANRDFGISESGYDFYYSQSWIDVIHFFEVPFYVISYCVSAETSLQIYRLENAQRGSGVDAYFRLLDRTYGAGVQQVMQEAGLENPFEPESLKKTAEFFRQELNLKEN